MNGWLSGPGTEGGAVTAGGYQASLWVMKISKTGLVMIEQL